MVLSASKVSPFSCNQDPGSVIECCVITEEDAAPVEALLRKKVVTTSVAQYPETAAALPALAASKLFKKPFLAEDEKMLTGLSGDVSKNLHAAYVGKSRTSGLSYGLP